MTVPCFRRLAADPSPQSPGFMPGSVRVRFVVERVAVGQVFLRVLWLYPFSTILPGLSVFIYPLGMNNISVSGRSSET
jgi:hypothetical protein